MFKKISVAVLFSFMLGAINASAFNPAEIEKNMNSQAKITALQNTPTKQAIVVKANLSENLDTSWGSCTLSFLTPMLHNNTEHYVLKINKSSIDIGKRILICKDDLLKQKAVVDFRNFPVISDSSNEYILVFKRISKQEIEMMGDLMALAQVITRINADGSEQVKYSGSTLDKGTTLPIPAQ